MRERVSSRLARKRAWLSATGFVVSFPASAVAGISEDRISSLAAVAEMTYVLPIGLETGIFGSRFSELIEIDPRD